MLQVINPIKNALQQGWKKLPKKRIAYFKMQNGDQDVKKTIMMTIGGCVAFIAMSEALPMFFK